MDKYTLKRQGEDVLRKLSYSSPQSVKADIDRFVNDVRASSYVYQSRGTQALNDVQRYAYDKNKLTEALQTIMSSL